MISSASAVLGASLHGAQVRPPFTTSTLLGALLCAVLCAGLAAVPSPAHAQQSDTVTLSGTITDATTGTPLTGASVYVASLERGSTAGEDGEFSLEVQPGRYTVRFDYVGYQSDSRTLDLRSDLEVDVELQRESIELDEVVVTDEAAVRNIESIETGVARLEVRKLEELPTFMGEVDIVRSLLLLPGVSTVGEGASGFNVRGGDVDQNLVLLDDAPIFYPSHLFGFFSPFNADVVEDVTLYRGGIPAQWGGRLSSVLDVEQKVGDHESYNMRGGVSPITSRFTIDGPIVEDKTSFLVGGRASYVNWLMNATGNDDLESSEAYFFDTNLGINQRVGKNDEINTTGYYSFDDFTVAGDTSYTYTMAHATAEWKHIFNDNLLSRVTGVVSDYSYDVSDSEPENAYTLSAGVRYHSLRADVTWLPSDRHTLDAGLTTKYYRIQPGGIVPDSEQSAINAFDLENEYALSSAIYVNEEYDLSEAWRLMGGLRISSYQRLGPGSILRFEDGQPRRVDTITEEEEFGSGEIINTFWGIEPRLAVRYKINDANSIKASYNRTRQYLHLISNTTAVTPVDVWRTSDANLPPQTGDQVTLGYFRNFRDGSITSSVEGYYKWIQDVVDYKPGAELTLNPDLATDLLQGRGRAYGIEMMLNKRSGIHKGSVSYTYSRSERQVDGSTPEQRISFGEWYPSNYDRPHELTVQYTYQEDPRISWNFNFVYRTGRPVTYPVSKFVVDGVPVANFSRRNQYRIPDYHRLDMSLRLDLEQREQDGWNGSWTFSIYNVYGRRNAYSVFFGRQLEGSVPQAYKLSVFGSIFPSLTYTFEY